MYINGTNNLNTIFGFNTIYFIGIEKSHIKTYCIYHIFQLINTQLKYEMVKMIKLN